MSTEPGGSRAGGAGTLDLPRDLVTESAFTWPADPLARGGMAEIFVGDDRRLTRQVILKTPRDSEHAALGLMFEQRVVAEAKILAKLAHPSIVTIYELGRATTGAPFCVLERVEGRSLRDRLDELAVDEAADGAARTRDRVELVASLIAIAEAMAYAHERRVVHRDITPNNILLGRRGEATLIDFGIARDLDAATASSALLDEPPSASGRWATLNAGTPPYVPYEQTQGHAAEPAYDVYSFGMVLYEVVAGRTAYAWKPDADVGKRHGQLIDFIMWAKEGGPVPPAAPRDPELSGIIARAIDRDPGNRFSADELVRALKQYLTGDLVFSHRYSWSGRAARWARQHRAATVAMGAVVLAAVAGALVWAQLSRQAQAQAELRATAMTARADAADKAKLAGDALAEAEVARQRAEQAEREGKDAQALRAEAEAKRRAADAMRGDAERAAAQAKGSADEAVARFREATRARDEADAARVAAEAARAAAEAARAAAEQQQATAQAGQAAAETARAAAETARAGAEGERDVARGAQAAAEAARTSAEQERDGARAAQGAAEAARTAAEQDRDEARRRLAALEARVRELEAQLAGGGGGGGGGGEAPPPPP